jgi:hypothetical protein
MTLNEAISAAMGTNSPWVKRACWNDRRLGISDEGDIISMYESGIYPCEGWTPNVADLQADDWETYEDPLYNRVFFDAGRKPSVKLDIDMSVIRRKMNIFALVSASIIFLAAVISMVIKLTS